MGTEKDRVVRVWERLATRRGLVWLVAESRISQGCGGKSRGRKGCLRNAANEEDEENGGGRMGVGGEWQ